MLLYEQKFTETPDWLLPVSYETQGLKLEDLENSKLVQLRGVNIIYTCYFLGRKATARNTQHIILQNALQREKVDFIWSI